MDSLKELREWFLEDPETRAAAFKIADLPTHQRHKDRIDN